MTSKEKTDEAERHARAARFLPDKSIKYLVGSRRRHLKFLRPWTLAQLLAWAILDQQPGQLPTKSDSTDTSAVRRRPLQTRCARDAGNHTLALLLDRKLSGAISMKDKALMAMLRLFKARGGFRVYVLAQRGKNLYEAARDAERELHYVYWIVDYLCRYKKCSDVENKLDIETAKQFIEQCAREGDKSYGKSKIEKIWLKYKDSAPYIFAFYPFLSCGLKRKATSPDQVMHFIEKLASNGPRLKRLLGRASYAADILNKLAHQVRIDDFKDIERAEPPLRQFNSFEWAMIHNIDREVATA